MEADRRETIVSSPVPPPGTTGRTVCDPWDTGPGRVVLVKEEETNLRVPGLGVGQVTTGSLPRVFPRIFRSVGGNRVGRPPVRLSSRHDSSTVTYLRGVAGPLGERHPLGEPGTETFVGPRNKVYRCPTSPVVVPGEGGTHPGDEVGEAGGSLTGREPRVCLRRRRLVDLVHPIPDPYRPSGRVDGSRGPTVGPRHRVSRSLNVTAARPGGGGPFRGPSGRGPTPGPTTAGLRPRVSRSPVWSGATKPRGGPYAGTGVPTAGDVGPTVCPRGKPSRSDRKSVVGSRGPRDSRQGSPRRGRPSPPSGPPGRRRRVSRRTMGRVEATDVRGSVTGGQGTERDSRAGHRNRVYRSPDVLAEEVDRPRTNRGPDTTTVSSEGV